MCWCAVSSFLTICFRARFASRVSAAASLPATALTATVTAVRRAKRHKACDDRRFLGLALDGTRAGRSRKKVCDLCRPYRNQQREILGYHHQVVMVSVVGTDLTLPLDVETYGPGDSEYSAGRRLLRRTVGNPGRRFMAKSRWEIENHGFNDAKNRSMASKSRLPDLRRPAKMTASNNSTFCATSR